MAPKILTKSSPNPKKNKLMDESHNISCALIPGCGCVNIKKIIIYKSKGKKILH